MIINNTTFSSKKLSYKENKKIQKYKKTVMRLLLALQGKNEDINRLKRYLTS